MFYLSTINLIRIESHETSNHVSPLFYHPALVWDGPSRTIVPFSEKPVLFPLCTVWASLKRVCSLPTDQPEKETHSVDMPLRNKRTKPTKRYKSILRKGTRRNRTRRIRRVRFVGGAAESRWYSTSHGEMTEEEYRKHKEYQDMNPDSY